MSEEGEEEEEPKLENWSPCVVRIAIRSSTLEENCHKTKPKVSSATNF